MVGREREPLLFVEKQKLLWSGYEYRLCINRDAFGAMGINAYDVCDLIADTIHGNGIKTVYVGFAFAISSEEDAMTALRLCEIAVKSYLMAV